MKILTSVLITSKMFELGSCASEDSDKLLVLCVIAEVSCPMPSGNSDTLQVMPGSSRSQAKCLNQPHFYFTFRDVYFSFSQQRERRKEKQSPWKRASKTLPELRHKRANAHNREGIFCQKRCRMQRAGGKEDRCWNPTLTGALRNVMLMDG